MKKSVNRTRRNLLKGIASLPFINGVAMTGAALNTSVATAMGSCTPKSLVCIFLAGGADSFNIFIPGGDRYDDYRLVRNSLGVDTDQLIEVSDSRLGSLAFNRATDSLADLYGENRLAVVSNCGPLIRPTTRADYENGIQLPQSLFAHDTQQKLWQNGAGFVGGGAGIGWGGRIAEYAAQCNTDAIVSPAFSINGANLWQTALATNYITVKAGVPVRHMEGYNNISEWVSGRRLNRMGKALDANNSAAQQLSPFRLEQEVGKATERAVQATTNLRIAFENNPVPQMVYDSSNRLAQQLHYVARLIAAREELGMRQQIFFVRMGGWDTHSDQLGRFPDLLSGLNGAIGPFQRAIDELGLSESVTSFTSSDFGRTLTSNGDGTDHGWGGHAFVFGGAVNGGQVIGDLPNYSSENNEDDTGDRRGAFAGRIIPQISVSQYGATIARWMGVPESDLSTVFPDLPNFAQTDLGFML